MSLPWKVNHPWREEVWGPESRAWQPRWGVSLSAFTPEAAEFARRLVHGEVSVGEYAKWKDAVTR